MPHYHHTEGICLRRTDYSNTSQVACFLTAEQGRLSVMAKGVTRAPKRGIRTGFDLLGRYELVYTTRRRSSLSNLTYRWLRERFHRPGRGLEGLLCGYYAAELMLKFLPEGEPCPALYDLLVRVLRNFGAGRSLGVGVLLLELAVLREHGSCPSFDACAECGASLPARGAVLFSPPAGGPLCPRCEKAPGRRHGGRTTTAPADLLRTLAALSSGASALPAGAPVTPETTLAMSALLRFHMRDLLGTELRLWKYLQGRHLSRALRRLRAGREE